MNFLLVFLATIVLQGGPVSGKVSKRETNEPISKVTMELRAFDSDSVLYTTVTRDDGAFIFPAVKSGKYRLRANRPGYVRIEYGQRKTSGRGSAIDFDSGQTLNNLKLVMTPTGAVAGRIYDATGQPIVKATVQAMKVGYASGKRSLTVLQTALADDRGDYRLFFLPPGQYYISAVMANWNISGDNITFSSGAPGSTGQGSRFMSPLTDGLEPARLGPGSEETGRYLPVYFPNTSDEDAASPVEVGPGGAVSGIDIQLTPIRTRRFRGVVIDGDTGQPPTAIPQPAQMIEFPNTSGSGGSPFVDRNTGAFDIQIPQVQSYVTAAGGLKMGRVMIPAGESDIQDFQIVMSAGGTVTGMIKVEGPETIPVASLRVLLRAEPQGIFGGQTNPQSRVVAANGSFSLMSVNPGDFRVNVTPILNTAPGPTAANIADALKKAYVKPIALGDVDILNNRWRITGRPEGVLQIVIGSDSHKVSGSTIGADQAPAGEATVVLVPDNRNRIDLYRTAIADVDGNYKFDAVPPGNYKAFAWDDVESGAWLDSRFLQNVEDRGTPVRVTNDLADVRLKVNP